MLTVQEQIADQMRGQGFEHVEIVADNANKEYLRHAHHEVTLRVVTGSIAIQLYEPPEKHLLAPGRELVIQEGREHSAKVGENGCLYAYAAKEADIESWEMANS